MLIPAISLLAAMYESRKLRVREMRVGIEFEPSKRFGNRRRRVQRVRVAVISVPAAMHDNRGACVQQMRVVELYKPSEPFGDYPDSGVR